MISAAVDNDVLTKGVTYGLFGLFCVALELELGNVGILETARFVASKRIKAQAPNELAEISLGELARVLSGCQVLNPSTAELYLAAELEASAQRVGVALDTGESQLCAIVISREIALLLTGDKRAIGAMNRLMSEHPDLEHLKGRVRCLEQLVLVVLKIRPLQVVRAAVCRAPTIDKALAYSFACRSEETTLQSVLEGLNSYIAAIDGQALIAGA